MSNEPLGIVEERAAARQYAGRFAYRAPTTAAKTHRITVDLKTGTITTETVAADVPPPRPPRFLKPAAPVVPPPPLGVLESPEAAKPDIFDIQSAFLAALAEESYTVDGSPYTLEDLRSPRRSRKYAWPRHVCIALARRICKSESFPEIAKAFGRRDHTTAMHACKRLPQHLESDPRLAGVYERVVIAFEDK